MFENIDRFAHAYLLYGHDEKVLEESALELITKALSLSENGISEEKARLVNLKTYPDMMIVQAEGKNVKIDSIRKVIRFLSLAAQFGDMKFAIIKDCQFLSIEAQNAMLKLLEEPLNNRMIILLADNTDNLLPTTLSRLFQIKISNDSSAYSSAMDEVLCEKIIAMLLEGEIETLFDVSAYMTKDKEKLNGFLMMLYNVFTDIYESKILNRNLKYPSFKEAADNISAKGANKVSEIIKGAIKLIRENASVVICTEAMLIGMREVYNAENSGNKI